MKVKYLIEELQQLDPDTDVYVSTDERVDMTKGVPAIGIGWDPPLDRRHPSFTKKVIIVA